MSIFKQNTVSAVLGTDKIIAKLNKVIDEHRVIEQQRAAQYNALMEQAGVAYAEHLNATREITRAQNAIRKLEEVYAELAQGIANE